jgi:hypothetical protein
VHNLTKRDRNLESSLQQVTNNIFISYPILFNNISCFIEKSANQHLTFLERALFNDTIDSARKTKDELEQIERNFKDHDLTSYSVAQKCTFFKNHAELYNITATKFEKLNCQVQVINKTINESPQNKLLQQLVNKQMECEIQFDGEHNRIQKIDKVY